MDKDVLAKIAKLEEQQKVIQQRIDNAKAAYKNKQKKVENKRKLLVGEYFLEKYKQENKLAELYKLMKDSLSKETDKKLFSE